MIIWFDPVVKHSCFLIVFLIFLLMMQAFRLLVFLSVLSQHTNPLCVI